MIRYDDILWDSHLKKVGIKHRLYLFFKRNFDIIISLLALIVLSPLFLFVAIAIKIDNYKGSIFYTQTRVGKRGKKFKIYKFRSMYSNAENLKQKLIQLNEVDGAMFKMHDDPRVTKVGRFIRKHSIDELPQLINVLIGDMSLVGPRPPLTREVAQYTNHDKLRLLVKPGCTGLWQVSGRNALCFKEMVSLDLDYISNSSILMDVKICFKTIWIMIFPNDAC